MVAAVLAVVTVVVVVGAVEVDKLIVPNPSSLSRAAALYRTNLTHYIVLLFL